MKYFILLLMVLTINQECSSVQDKNLTKQFYVVYGAITRGASIEYKVNNEQMVVNSVGLDKKSIEKALTPKDGDKIISLVKEIELDNMKNLIPPSKNSTDDRAFVAGLIVSINGKIYESAPFDYGNPPKELKSLIDQMLTLAETVE